MRVLLNFLALPGLMVFEGNYDLCSVFGYMLASELQILGTRVYPEEANA